MSAAERFISVLSGKLASTVGSTGRNIWPRTTIVVTPGADELTLQSLDKAGSEIVVFERTGS